MAEHRHTWKGYQGMLGYVSEVCAECGVDFEDLVQKEMKEHPQLSRQEAVRIVNQHSDRGITLQEVTVEGWKEYGELKRKLRKDGYLVRGRKLQDGKWLIEYMRMPSKGYGNPPRKALEAEARRLGIRAGSEAAEWAAQDSFGGRVTREAKETARRIIEGYEEGDPEVLDAFRVPDLSGEYSGDPTPSWLHKELGIEDMEPEEQSDIEIEYLEGASEGFWDTLIGLARAELGEDNPMGIMLAKKGRSHRAFAAYGRTSGEVDSHMDIEHESNKKNGWKLLAYRESPDRWGYAWQNPQEAKEIIGLQCTRIECEGGDLEGNFGKVYGLADKTVFIKGFFQRIPKGHVKAVEYRHDPKVKAVGKNPDGRPWRHVYPRAKGKIVISKVKGGILLHRAASQKEA